MGKNEVIVDNKGESTTAEWKKQNTESDIGMDETGTICVCTVK